MPSTPTLHVWHDYVCPFSYVAASRITRLKNADNLNLDVRFHPWALEAANGTQPAATDEDQWVRLLRTVEPDAFAGWDPSSDTWPRSSSLLFAAYEAALEQGTEAAQRFDLSLRQAIFQHPRPIDTMESLSEIAAEVGLDVDRFRVALEDGSADRPVQASQAEMKSLGIRGIPTLVLPDGERILNPGLKIYRTEQGRGIRDDLHALRELLRKAAGAIPAGSPDGR